MPAVWNPKANALFLEVLEQPPGKREAFLARACREDLALAEQVRALLDANDQAGNFLESPHTVAANLADTAREIEAESPGLEFLAPSQRPDSLGRLGHYEILGIVGSGGFGVVLRAFDEHLHRIVAIKILNQSLAASATARGRFVREARAAAAINHENVVIIYAVEELGPVPYLVMEYMGGVSLEEKLKQSGPPGVKEILRIGLQIAAGLAAAHKQGLVHRDVKPANILLENSVERVKITDFGLARTVNDVELTQTGMIAGTPSFMSPEQANGESVDFRSDLFSLGSVLYAMCAGRAPFRGETSLGVLRQVCDGLPHPLRDLNPDVPDWLAAIVAKLHAKNVSDRYQSAAEVADLLNHHLAQLQQPSLSQKSVFDGSPKTVPNRQSIIGNRHRLIVAAAATLMLACTLALTEARGVTHLATTVIRILTPDGTLVVETGDPHVNVTVEGNGGLVITSAGLEEIRLRPGSYRVHADKEGKPIPLDKELVSITRGDRKIVRVKLEAAAPAPAAVPVELGAFVLLGGMGVAESKFDTLAEAVLNASDGDTIEVRGNGPFISPPLDFRNQSLTIRAASGYLPVFDLKADPEWKFGHFAGSRMLNLEGLEFHGARARSTNNAVAVDGGLSLHAASCRFALPDWLCFGCYVNTRRIQIRNCEFVGCSTALAGKHAPGGDWLMDNCVQVNGFVMGIQSVESNPMTVRIAHFTHVGPNSPLQLHLHWNTVPLDPSKEELVRIEVKSSVLATPWIVETVGYSDHAANDIVPGSAEFEKLLQRRLAWQGEQNLYVLGFVPTVEGAGLLLSCGTAPDLKYQRHGPPNLTAWKEYWTSFETGSLEGPVRFQGGDLLGRTNESFEKVTPGDFRLRPDSAGYRAGPDRKDLGADVDLVGPGPAYERWKKTPAYQEWLREK